MTKNKGWKGEPRRHSLARRRIKTANGHFMDTDEGRAFMNEESLSGYDIAWRDIEEGMEIYDILFDIGSRLEIEFKGDNDNYTARTLIREIKRVDGKSIDFDIIDELTYWHNINQYYVTKEIGDRKYILLTVMDRYNVDYTIITEIREIHNDTKHEIYG